MRSELKYPLAIASVYLWIGFVCAISFMESWLKFQASGVNLSAGLSIGRLVFNALNKVEWVFALAIIINLLAAKEKPHWLTLLSLLIPIGLLVLQTVWLLPILDERAQARIHDINLVSSNHHFFYIAIEIIKVICLFILSINLFKQNT